MTALMPSLLSVVFSLFLRHLRTLAQGKRLKNYVFLGLVAESLYPLSSRNNNGARTKNKFWRCDLLMLLACTIGILSTLMYTEFDCAALLAML